MSARHLKSQNKKLMERSAIGHATLAYSHFIEDEDDSAIFDQEVLIYDPSSEEDESPFLLHDLGGVDLEVVMQAIDAICEKYLSDLESDLVWLMRQGRRPVEISRILRIPECEVVRLRRNCFRKIRTVYLYDYHHNKASFLAATIPLLGLNPKQARIYTMFFNYYGLRQIAQTIGTRPSNIHRSLQMMKRKLQQIAAGDTDEPTFDHFYLQAFEDFKYLCLTLRSPE